MAVSTTELKQLLLRYINEYKGIDRLREVLQTTTVEDRYEALMSVRGDGQRTAVHRGAMQNDMQRYNLLRIQDNVGDTALHDAATKKHNNVLQVMLSSVTPDQQKLLLNIKNNKTNTIAAITSLPELPYDVPAWTRLELDKLKKRFKQQEAVTSRQAEELYSAKEKLNSTKEELASTKEVLTAVKESHEQQKAVVARQAIALEEASHVVAASSRQIEELVENNNELEKDKSQQAQELYSAKEELSSTKEGLASTKEELTTVKDSHEQQKAVVARQANALEETNKVVAASSKQIEELVEKNNQLEKHNNQQAHALIQVMSDLGEQRRLVERETNQRVEELSALKETHETVVAGQDAELSALKETHDAVVAGQDAELQQLRYNQTEMLRMIEALEISLGKPTSDQENEW